MKNKSGRIIFITGNVYSFSPQGIRYTNLIKYFNPVFDVTLMSQNSGLLETECRKQLLVGTHSKDFEINQHGQAHSLLKDLIKKCYKFALEPFLFPDKEIFKLIQYKKIFHSELLAGNIYDYVIIGMTPYSLYILTYFVKRYFKKAKVIIDLSDPFVENQGLNYPGFVKKYFVPVYERFFLKYVDCVVVLNPKIKELYLKKYSSVITESKIEVIEQGFKSNIGKNVKIKPPSSQILLVYAGVFVSGLREPFTLYSALGLMGSACKLHLYGNISQTYLPDTKIVNCEYYGTINQTDLFEVYSNADLLIIIDNKNGYQVPGKTLELGAMKKPVLFLYENENSPTLYYANKIPSFFKIKNERDEIQKFLKSFISGEISPNYDFNIDEYSWENISKKYVNFLEELNSVKQVIE